MRSLQKLTTICVIFVLVSNVQTRPKASPPLNSLSKMNNCESNEVAEETCQKCAKLTKSVHAYPMCCNDDDGVYAWCDRYVHFGMQHS